MSACEPSGEDPTHLSDYDYDPPEADYLVSDGHHIPPDPLLGSDTFIEVNPDPTGPTLTTKPQPAPNGVPESPQPEQNLDPEPDQCTSPVAGVSNGTDPVTPSATTKGAESTPPPSRRKAAAAAAPAPLPDVLPERPTWLPEGWRMEFRVRASGATAGSVDRYYFEPVSGRKFRSKKEVDYFLQTGSKPSKKRAADADANSKEKSGSAKKKKAAPKAAPLNFDFNDVPEKVRWVLTDAVNDQWTPFLGDKIVPKSNRQEWKAAFEFCCS